VNIIPFRRFRKNPVSFLCFVFSYFSAGIRLYKFIKKNNISIVHFSDLIDAPFYPWAWIAKTKPVAHVRVCFGSPITRFFFRKWAHLFCSHIITISHFAKTYYGFGKRTSVIYNPGPDRALFDPAKTQPVSGIKSDTAPTVITAAAFRREKGHHNFLEIASRIRRQLPMEVRFVIIGGEVQGHEDYYEEMMERAQRLGLCGCLTVTGNIPHEEVPSIMANAAVFMFVPDWEEALGGVVLEAISLGIPVVAFDKGGISECFTDGKSGFLIEHGNLDDAANRVITLLKSPSLINSVTDEARVELDNKFTIDKYVCGVEQVYERLSKENGKLNE
jgi:glycosyltransferase involved in cell wall biosynthesis